LHNHKTLLKDCDLTGYTNDPTRVRHKICKEKQAGAIEALEANGPKEVRRQVRQARHKRGTGEAQERHKRGDLFEGHLLRGIEGLESGSPQNFVASLPPHLPIAV
jgi:hypothetical protein